MKARTVAVCYDDAPEAAAAAAWAAAAFAAPGDELHLIGIAAAAALLPPVPPISPVGLGGASTVQALHEAWREESERVAQALEREATALGARATPPVRHTLSAAGGASGVGAAAVEWADARSADAIVLGRRGLGAVRATAYAAVGLGSVSSWVLHNAKTPVVVVPRAAPAPSSGGTTWVVAVDDSPHAARALGWALARAAGPADRVHCVAAATPAPYILADDDAVVAHPLHAAEAERRAADARAYARTVAEGAARRAADALGASRVAWHVLTPRGDGPGDVGGALAEYAGQQLHGALVLGSRGQGAAKRALLSLVGLGSVSDWCAKNAGVPVAVVRPGAAEQ